MELETSTSVATAERDWVQKIESERGEFEEFEVD
jgi:hypothetical protein